MRSKGKKSYNENVVRLFYYFGKNRKRLIEYQLRVRYLKFVFEI